MAKPSQRQGKSHDEVIKTKPNQRQGKSHHEVMKAKLSLDRKVAKLRAKVAASNMKEPDMAMMRKHFSLENCNREERRTVVEIVGAIREIGYSNEELVRRSLSVEGPYGLICEGVARIRTTAEGTSGTIKSLAKDETFKATTCSEGLQGRGQIRV